jgi:hypothetical protein
MAGVVTDEHPADRTYGNPGNAEYRSGAVEPP